MSLGSKLYEVSQRARQCLNRWRIATKGDICLFFCV